MQRTHSWRRLDWITHIGGQSHGFFYAGKSVLNDNIMKYIPKFGIFQINAIVSPHNSISIPWQVELTGLTMCIALYGFSIILSMKQNSKYETSNHFCIQNNRSHKILIEHNSNKNTKFAFLIAHMEPIMAISLLQSGYHCWGSSFRIDSRMRRTITVCS